MILLCLPMLCLGSPTPILYQVTMKEHSNNSASTHHHHLIGLYWQYKPDGEGNAAVFQKTEETNGKRAYVFRKGEGEYTVGPAGLQSPLHAKGAIVDTNFGQGQHACASISILSLLLTHFQGTHYYPTHTHTNTQKIFLGEQLVY